MRAIRPRVSWQTPWLTDVPLRGRIPRSHACATRHIPLSFTFFLAVSLLVGILSTLSRQPPLTQRRKACEIPLPPSCPSRPQLYYTLRPLSEQQEHRRRCLSAVWHIITTRFACNFEIGDGPAPQGRKGWFSRYPSTDRKLMRPNAWRKEDYLPFSSSVP